MRAIRQKVQGKLFQNDGEAVLWLSRDGDPAISLTPSTVYLRYALLVRGYEQPFFPAELLNDWGETIRGTKLYRWLRENGELNPRAELFGFDANGKETQYFARDLELFWKTPCFAFPDPDAPLIDRVPLSNIMVLTPAANTLEKIKRPTGVKSPMRRASVKWWQISPEMLTQFQFGDQFA
ncbi:MAG: hypothetical protein ACPG8W_04140 [Candidatus Promineifilaceae bacterium]